jgi:long-chain acyl-CoA synthetase
VRDIGEANATIVPVVPRILEKMKSGIEERARSSGLSAFIVRLVLTGMRARVAELRGEPRVSRLGLALYRGTAKIRRGIVEKLFGVNLVNAISGGAKLADGVNYFFEALGAPVLQGYGLTETCVATNVNRVASNRIGTVGPVLAPDIELRIADDGEILFRGPNIALGYLNRTKATLDAWDLEGWFHTGDVGALSADGYLSITGRKKELIVTAGGKKIAPESVEMKLKASAVFSQVVLAGEAKPYCIAIVTLNPAVVQERLGERVDTSRPLSAQDAVRALVDAEIVRINSQLASFETVKRALVVDEDFTIDNGFLTPTLKVKRMAVIKRFQDQIDRLYQND